MRTAVYALAGLAAASGVSAFMPQASFTGRAPSLRAGRSRPAVSVGEPLRPARHFCKSASARHSAASNTHTGGQRRRRASAGSAHPPGGEGVPQGAHLLWRLCQRSDIPVGRVRARTDSLHGCSALPGGERGAGPPVLRGRHSLRLERPCGASLARSSLLSLLCVLRPWP